MASKCAPKKKGHMPFEESRRDKEPRKMKEGSAREERFDARQMKRGKPRM